MMIASFIMAGAATLILALILVGGAMGTFAGPGSGVIIVVLFVAMLGCVVSGFGMGVGSIDRQLNNPVLLWIAASWNGLLFLGLALITIVGLMMKNK